MKALAVIGMLSAVLMFNASNAYADDLDVTMDVMDSSSSAIDKLMNPIDLPDQASEKAHDVQANSEHGLGTANAARASAADRLEANSHSEDASDNVGDHADMASDNASQAADAASDNASEAAGRASDNASEHASQGLANVGH